MDDFKMRHQIRVKKGDTNCLIKLIY